MIHKINSINSIGKFRSYQARGDVAFRKATLIYADNGSGKTTLSSILRSLTSNNPDLLKNRISTDSTIAQFAQIIQRVTGNPDSFHSFSSRGWSVAFPNIEIFDVHFINENVYSGFDFNDDQKRHLHEFVIGAQGIGFKVQIEQNKAYKTESRKKISEIEQQILNTVSNGLSQDRLNRYLHILPQEAENIEGKIAEAQSILAIASSTAVIQSLSILSPLKQIDIRLNIKDIISEFKETITTIQDAVQKSLYDYHCIELAGSGIINPENWIGQGVNYINAREDNAQKTCPFCTQTIGENLEIIKAYALHFNKAFNEFVAKLQLHFAAAQAINVDAMILPLVSIIDNNVRYASSWIAHIPEATIPTYNIVEKISLIKEAIAKVLSAIAAKQLNLSAEGDDAPIKELSNLMDSINSNIQHYNDAVEKYNGAIVTFRGNIKTVVVAQAELNRLICIKKRFEPVVATLCDQLVREKSVLKTLEIDYTDLVRQQEVESESFLVSYKDRINHYLTNVFNTPFRIENVANIAPQGKSTQSKLGYKLTINGKDMSFSPNTVLSATDCLSEGDRSTIALSLFLSKLDIDPNLADKILVFDDPLSSFDSKRRMYTVELIHTLFPKICQIIVLSHNEFFLHDISKGIGAGDKTTLRITENFVDKASLIEPLSLETLVDNDYYKHVDALVDFLSHADITKKEVVLGWTRNVLEGHIRLKFYRQTKHLQPNDRTFGKLISALETSGVIFRDNANRDFILSRLKLINAISCKPHHGDGIPDFATVGINPNSITVSELANIVTDTLDFIDNKL